MENVRITYYEWNQELDDYDVFVHCPLSCVPIIQEWYPKQSITSAYLLAKDGYYYLINTKKKIISPLPDYNLAFGNLYNGWFPVGNNLPNYTADFEQLALLPYHSDYLKFPPLNNHSNKQ